MARLHFLHFRGHHGVTIARILIIAGSESTDARLSIVPNTPAGSVNASADNTATAEPTSKKMTVRSMTFLARRRRWRPKLRLAAGHEMRENRGAQVQVNGRQARAQPQLLLEVIVA